MIICHCYSITDKEIRRAAQRPGADCREVSARCGAGTACKSCLPAIRALLQRQEGDRRRVPTAHRK